MTIEPVRPQRGSKRPGRSPSQRGPRLRSVEETSAGGLVVDIHREAPAAALIGRFDKRGRIAWSLPKGHVEEGETTEEAAVREVWEETGIVGEVVASLGPIDFWFMTPQKKIHKTVHHFLLRAVDGELSSADVEVEEVAWVPLVELPDRLRYGAERRLLAQVNDLLLRQPGLLDGPAR